MKRTNKRKIDSLIQEESILFSDLTFYISVSNNNIPKIRKMIKENGGSIVKKVDEKVIEGKILILSALIMDFSSIISSMITMEMSKNNQRKRISQRSEN